MKPPEALKFSGPTKCSDWGERRQRQLIFLCHKYVENIIRGKMLQESQTVHVGKGGHVQRTSQWEKAVHVEGPKLQALEK